jgi:glucose-1-phosphate cytidylyltransferase
MKFHRAHNRLATVTTVRPTSRFGILELNDEGGVDSFAEKPQADGWVNAGYFIFNKRVFDYLDGDDCIMERQPLEKLASEGELMAFRHDGFFFAMDTYREYLYLNDLWKSGEAPWKVWND